MRFRVLARAALYLRSLSTTPRKRSAMPQADLPPQAIPEWVLRQEPLERYKAKGYRPTFIGERLHGGRYQILSKLGFGEESTVWLASDVESR